MLRSAGHSVVAIKDFVVRPELENVFFFSLALP